jgi:hypothetical protein
MSKPRDFAQRIGNVFLPLAEDVAISSQSESAAMNQAGTIAGGPDAPPIPIPIPPPLLICKTVLKEGCYSINFQPKGSSVLGPRYVGTLRVENIGGGAIRFSGDFYTFFLVILPVPQPPVMLDRIERIRLANLAQAADGPTEDAPGVIPIYQRRKYYSYLKGKAATLTTVRLASAPCWFSLDFDEYKYTHPATGFSGTFPAAPTRALRFTMNYTATPNSYTGKVLQGTTELGTISMQWISPFFRRASLSIYRLVGAENPPASVPGTSGAESFKTVFATAGWDLSVSFAGDIPLPASLSGVQDPKQCWSQANCATLMSSIPGYNPADLDMNWRAYLMAIPAKLGCSRGQMFDLGSGNPNNIAREGAVTHSHDGYPTTDSSHFGAAANGLQKDFPRAFLRSASHEVGHTFNQIHQELEGGSDNSIMTTTPSVADVLFSQSKTFPNDINLGFNARVRRHLIHLPDPAVRPGAMEFFGAAVNAPQADQILWPAEFKLEVTVDQTHIALGEPAAVSWTLTNQSEGVMLAPTTLDIESLTARVSVTDPAGNTTFLRPAEQKACVHVTLGALNPGESVTGSTNVFWGRDGFAFERPGRHIVEVIALWQVGEMWVGANAETDVWISYPHTDNDNRVAALMLHPEVGRAIAAPHAAASPLAVERLQQAAKIHAKHPALGRLKALGMAKRLSLPE